MEGSYAIYWSITMHGRELCNLLKHNNAWKGAMRTMQAWQWIGGRYAIYWSITMHGRELCKLCKHNNAWKGEGAISMKKSVDPPPCCDTIQNPDTFFPPLRVTTRVAMSNQHSLSPKKGLQIMQPLHLFFRASILVHVCVCARSDGSTG